MVPSCGCVSWGGPRFSYCQPINEIDLDLEYMLLRLECVQSILLMCMLAASYVYVFCVLFVCRSSSYLHSAAEPVVCPSQGSIFLICCGCFYIRCLFLSGILYPW